MMFVMLFGFPPFRSVPPEDRTHRGQPGAYERSCRCSECQVMTAINTGFEPVVKAGYGPWFPEQMPLSTAAYDLLIKLFQKDVRTLPLACL